MNIYYRVSEIHEYFDILCVPCIMILWLFMGDKNLCILENAVPLPCLVIISLRKFSEVKQRNYQGENMKEKVIENQLWKFSVNFFSLY